MLKNASTNYIYKPKNICNLIYRMNYVTTYKWRAAKFNLDGHGRKFHCGKFYYP